MKATLRQVVLVLLLGSAMAPMAGAAPAQEPIPECVKIGDATHCTPESAAPEAGKVKDAVAPDRTGGVAGFFGSLGQFIGDTTKAIGEAVQATGELGVSLFVGIGSLVVGLLRGYADLLASLRPDALSVPIYAGLAAAGTAAAAGAAQAGAWVGLKKLLPFLPLVPGFSRIEKDELLENERRARIFELIKHSPGIHLSEIARELDFAWGTTLHHLRKLRADRLVTFKSMGHHKSFFINGSGLSEKQMEAMSLIKNGTLAQLANFLEAHPQTSLKELSEALGISPPLAAFHIRKLEKAGFVRKVREGKSVRLSTTEAVPAGFFQHIAQTTPVSPEPVASAS